MKKDSIEKMYQTYKNMCPNNQPIINKNLFENIISFYDKYFTGYAAVDPRTYDAAKDLLNICKNIVPRDSLLYQRLDNISL